MTPKMFGFWIPTVYQVSMIWIKIMLVSSLWLTTSPREGALNSGQTFSLVRHCAVRRWGSHDWPVDILIKVLHSTRVRSSNLPQVCLYSNIMSLSSAGLRCQNLRSRLDKETCDKAWLAYICNNSTVTIWILNTWIPDFSMYGFQMVLHVLS